MSVLEGNFAFTDKDTLGTATNAATSHTASQYDTLYCPDFHNAPFTMNSATAILDIDGNAMSTPSGSATADDAYCYEVANTNCIRFKITFVNTPGVKSGTVTVNTEDVTIGGLTNDQDDKGILGEVVTRSFTTNVGFSHPNVQTVSCGAAECDIVSGEVSLNGNAADKFNQHETVSLFCNGKKLGKFTISDTPTYDGSASTTFNVAQNVPDCDGSTSMAVELETFVIKINGRHDAAAENGLQIGESIVIGSDDPTAPITATHYYATEGVTRLHILDPLLIATTRTHLYSTPSTFVVPSVGTREASECSDRGLCDRETGICGCFKGYSGDACELQNNYAVGI